MASLVVVLVATTFLAVAGPVDSGWIPLCPVEDAGATDESASGAGFTTTGEADAEAPEETTSGELDTGEPEDTSTGEVDAAPPEETSTGEEDVGGDGASEEEQGPAPEETLKPRHRSTALSITYGRRN